VVNSVPKIILRLFVAGQTARSERAIANLHLIVARANQACDIQIVNVVNEPALADRDHIIATPTLIKVDARSERRVIGDLSNIDEVLYALNLGSPAAG
jgi:circadian clock protein KaiB